jgi:hypothetical protein
MSDNQSDTPLSLITTGALNPDQKLKSLRGAKALSRVQESAPYTERISALMLMTGNITIAGIPLLIVIVSKSALRWWHTLIGIGILLLIYLEHWRLFYARNLRHSLAIDAASQENERIVS